MEKFEKYCHKTYSKSNIFFKDGNKYCFIFIINLKKKLKAKGKIRKGKKRLKLKF